MIGLFYGTRPEFIKLLPLIDELEARKVKFALIQVSQHTDLIRDCFGDQAIKIKSHGLNRLNDIYQSIMDHDLSYLKYALVQGDTATAAAVALSAFHQQVPVMHLEAGMRTYNKQHPYPEEVNRRIISALASVHYCATQREKQFLIDEGFVHDDILVTGNTVIDNLVGMQPRDGNKVIVTLHRRENLPMMNWWFNALEDLAREYPQYEFVFPMHPNPEVQKHKHLLKTVKVCDPVSHDEMADMIASCHCIITDSGGIQEEASFFKKPCFVCRKGTERPCEGSVLVDRPDDLHHMFTHLHDRQITHSTPFGDGNAGVKIAEDIQKRVR